MAVAVLAAPEVLPAAPILKMTCQRFVEATGVRLADDFERLRALVLALRGAALASDDGVRSPSTVD